MSGWCSFVGRFGMWASSVWYARCQAMLLASPRSAGTTVISPGTVIDVGSLSKRSPLAWSFVCLPIALDALILEKGIYLVCQIIRCNPPKLSVFRPTVCLLNSGNTEIFKPKVVQAAAPVAENWPFSITFLHFMELCLTWGNCGIISQVLNNYQTTINYYSCSSVESSSIWTPLC